MRAEGDSLKIFANVGLNEELNQFKYEFKSAHVWNDAEGIFLTKEDIGEGKGIAVYVVGNAKTVYILSCEFVKENYHSLELNENLYEYIQPRHQATYHMNLSTSATIDSFVVRFSVFTGEVEVGFYYDSLFTRPFNKLPFQYMSDIQFHIEREDLTNETKDIYMRVTARDAPCTYQLNLQGRKKVEGFEMYENVFEFVPVRGRQMMYFYSHIWSESQFDVQREHIFDISMIRVEG
jgi:hypothetical protein